MMTTQDVANLLRVKPDTVRRWAREGELPVVTLGGVLRFDPNDVKKFVDKGRSK